MGYESRNDCFLCEITEIGVFFCQCSFLTYFPLFRQLFLAVGPSLLHGVFSSCSSGLLSFAMLGLRCGDFLLWGMGSRALGFQQLRAPRLQSTGSSCGKQSQQLQGMWDLLDQGSNPGINPSTGRWILYPWWASFNDVLKLFFQRIQTVIMTKTIFSLTSEHLTKFYFYQPLSSSVHILLSLAK